MNQNRFAVAGITLALVVGVIPLLFDASWGSSAKSSEGKESGKPYGIAKRIPWTTSKVKGSPEPPLPYKAQRVFPDLTFHQPLDLVATPGTRRFFVAEQHGKIFSFPNDPKCQKADLFIDLPKEWKHLQPEPNASGVSAVYALAFHPKFQSNRYCYICYILRNKTSGKALANGTRVSRFKVTDTDPPRCDPKSEQVIITWLEGGHNGCCLKFGPDGMLYISTGDATDPSPPDGLDTGQGVDDLLSCILRIDVDRTENGKAYAIPPDNPFVKLPGACPEIWAFGFRNPWRMSFDRATGALFVGDVGWELWELVHLVKRGGNYGWSVMEGRQPVRHSAKKGPTPILPPALEFPHTEAASVTGGFVYRGKKYPELVGTYLCGDWETRKIWGAKFDGEKLLPSKLIAETSQRIVGFAEDDQGELYWLDHDPKGGIYQIVPSEEPDTSKTFPRQLSQTGLLKNTATHELTAGVVPFSINAEQWLDHASAERFIALPGTSTVQMFQQPQPIPKSMFQSKYFFPKDGVLMKTISLEMEQGNPASKKRIETQILHFNGTTWNPYTYQWNDQQTDAVLVDGSGTKKVFKVKDGNSPGGMREQTWHFPGRGQCLQCHNPWAGYNLAFTPAQLDRDHDYGATVDNQLRTLEHIGIFAHGGKAKSGVSKYWEPLVNPHDDSGDIHKPVRSYLHVNCAHCHQSGAGGTALIDLRHDQPLENMKALEIAPVQGDFGMTGASILSPGDPYKSVLYYRMATLGKGRMPHIGSSIVDKKGLQLVHDWIRALPLHKNENALIQQLTELEKTKKNPAKQKQIINTLLNKTSSALLMAKAVEDGKLSASLKQKVIQQAITDSPPHIRDLFERFIPDSQKLKRLGDLINPAEILKLAGNAERGKQLLLGNDTMQCLKCHKLGNQGIELGPDLSKIGGKLNRAQLLENLLTPSKAIEPKYIAQTVVTADGKIVTGFLMEKTAKEIVLRDAQGQLHRLPGSNVEQMIASKTSLMPEGLLRDLTATQAADLLEYLQSLK